MQNGIAQDSVCPGTLHGLWKAVVLKFCSSEMPGAESTL